MQDRFRNDPDSRFQVLRPTFDRAPRWIKKHGKGYFGYKNHIRFDAESKLIREWEVTPAHVHDSQVFEDVLKEVKQRHTVYADNAYADETKEERLDKERGIYCLKCQRGAERMWWNTMVARTRSRVEHVFGWMTKAMGGKGQRAITLRRNTTGEALTNVVYNMCPYSRAYYAPT